MPLAAGVGPKRAVGEVVPRSVEEDEAAGHLPRARATLKNMLCGKWALLRPLMFRRRMVQKMVSEE